MYVKACTTAAVATCTAAVLPNTGVVTNNAVALAIAVLAGMLTWGVMYARANR